MPPTSRVTTRWLLAGAALAAVTWVAPIAPAQVTPLPDTSQTVQQDLAQLSARLSDESARQDERDEAARRLVSRATPEAHGILRGALESGNRNAQLAAARALSTDPKPDPELIPLLFPLLGPDRPLTEAAAQALSIYRNNPDVTLRLSNLAMARPEREPTRIAAIRALGTMADKNAADTLVGLLGRTDENPAIANAASDALVDMTGLRENGRDVQKWRRWWAENTNRSEEDFRLSLLNNQASRFDQLLLRHRQLEDELSTLLSDQYQLAPDSQKPDLLLRYLKSPEPAIRTTGARQVSDDAVNNRTIPPGVLEQMRGMIGDSSPEVRVAVADGLRAVNDASAVTPLLTQLAQETEDPVRSAIARALAVSGDLRALAPLRALLHDPSLSVAQSAADALRDLGPKLRDIDPESAKQTAAELGQVLDKQAEEAGTQTLRESVVLAMASMREPSMLPTYYRLLRGREPGPIRRAAVKALGELRQPQAADAVVNLLEDPDATVRLEAVDALGKTGSFQHAEAVYKLLSPAAESDRSVRDHAWLVLEGLFANAPSGQLVQWADRFADDPARRLVVLAALADREAGDNHPEPLANARKAVGETLLALNRPADAVPYFRQSLEYWNTRDPKGMSAVALNQQLLTALLRAKQYPAAVAFGGELLSADLSNQQTVGPAFRTETQRLLDANDLTNAQTLITESRKMSPPLDARYTESLTSLESEIQRRLTDLNQHRTTGPRSETVDVHDQPFRDLIA